MTATTFTELSEPLIQRGRYMIPDPETGKLTALTRVTSYIGALDNGQGLTRWKLGMVARGLAASPELIAAVNDDPDSGTLYKLCDDALDAAGANDKRDLGTLIHHLCETADLGHEPPVSAELAAIKERFADYLADHAEADVAAYREAMQRAGLSPIAEGTEVVCVNWRRRIAGRLDRLVAVEGQELPCGLDIKTGTLHPFTVAQQVKCYMEATSWFDVDSRTHMTPPAVCQDWGYVAQIAPREARCTIWRIDLRDVSQMLDTIDTIKAWQSRGAVRKQPRPDDLASVVVEYVAPADALTLTAEWAAGRVEALRDNHPAALTDLANSWPAGVATFKAVREGVATHTADDLRAINAVLDAVEARHTIPFPEENNPSGPLAYTDPRLVDVRHRGHALPADLAERVGTIDTPTVHELDDIVHQLNELEAMADNRAGLAEAHLMALPAEVRYRYEVKPPIDAVALERIENLADAYSLGLVVEGDSETLRPADDATEQLLERFGARAELVAAAKDAAARLGLSRPRSTADVVASLHLVAALAVTETGDGTPQQKEAS
jgi:hypothetical protein